MTEFIILDKSDVTDLCDNKLVTFYVNEKRYVLLTEECYEKQIRQKTRIMHEDSSNKEGT